MTLNRKVEDSEMNNIVDLAAAKQQAPTIVNGKVLPRRRENKDVRSREYLTNKEVDQLMDAARKTGQHGHRDASLILIGYRHALRVSELVSLRWDQINLGQGLLHGLIAALLLQFCCSRCASSA